MVSYQCSPLSTPDGIVSIFGQCAQLQKENGDLDKFVAVVVLDEVGLAEDSPRMPLKVFIVNISILKATPKRKAGQWISLLK